MIVIRHQSSPKSSLELYHKHCVNFTNSTKRTPLLSGHLGRSRRCPLNRGITVLECGRPICLSTTCMITERIRRHEVPLPNLYYFKLVKIHSRAREIAHTTSKARSPSRHDEYCLTMKEKEALSFCS